jgi:hypothetical protein
VAAGIEGLVPVAGVTHGDPLHGGPQWPVADLHQRVQVIRHPAIGVESVVNAAQDIGHHLVENVAIVVGREQRFAMVTPEAYVIAATRYVKSGRSGHPCDPLVKSDPETSACLP